MGSDAILKGMIKQSALEMLERLKHLDNDDRFAMLEEYGMWWFDKIDIDDELFVPDFVKSILILLYFKHIKENI